MLATALMRSNLALFTIGEVDALESFLSNTYAETGIPTANPNKMIIIPTNDAECYWDTESALDTREDDGTII